MTFVCAGLCRTSEIFGVSEFVIGNLTYLEDRMFQSLSVSAQKWISITEVRRSLLFPCKPPHSILCVSPPLIVYFRRHGGVVFFFSVCLPFFALFLHYFIFFSFLSLYLTLSLSSFCLPFILSLISSPYPLHPHPLSFSLSLSLSLPSLSFAINMSMILLYPSIEQVR